MRRLLVLAALLGLVLGVRVLGLGAESYAATTLASVGFVILTAYTVSELGRAAGLPRVTGYILAGALLGPSVGNILSRHVVTDMKMFNSLALGLIAITGGLELDLKALARLARTILSTVALKIVLSVSLVAATFYLVESQFSILGLGSTGAIVALALVFGAISLDTSPAIALAVMAETKARGRLMDLVLGTAILKDVVVVTCTAVALSVGETFLRPEIALSSEHLTALMVELGSSVLAGALLGLLLIAYLHFVGAEMLLFVAAMILVVAEGTKAFHLELLLVFIVAGVVVRNLTHRSHDLLHAAETVSLPVFVIFFTIAGASLDLKSLWAVLPLGVALAGARAVAYYWAGRWGGAVGGESPLIRHRAWLGYMPQAGATLGLLALSAEKLPMVARELTSVGMAVVAIQLLVGPITLRLVLRQAGEIPEDANEGPLVPSLEPGAESPTESPSGGLASVGQTAERLAEDLRERALAPLLPQLTDQLNNYAEELLRDEIRPWRHLMHQRLQELLSPKSPGPAERIREWSATYTTTDPHERARAVELFHRQCREVLKRCPDFVEVPLREDLARPQPGDSRLLRWRKRAATVGRVIALQTRPQRRVPVALAARHALEAPLAVACLELTRSWSQAQARMIHEMRLWCDGRLTLEELDGNIRGLLDDCVRDADEQLSEAIRQGLYRFASSLDRVGSSTLPAAAVRYSEVEPKVRSALVDIDTEAPLWAQALQQEVASLHVALHLAALGSGVCREVENRVVTPAVTALAAVTDEARSLAQELRTLEAAARDDSSAQLPARVQLGIAHCFDQERRGRLESAAALFRSRASAHAVSLEARKNLQRLPEELTTSALASPLFHLTSPKKAAARTVRLRALATRALQHDLLPRLDEELKQAASSVAQTATCTREANSIATHAVEVLGDLPTLEAREELAAAMGRAAGRVEQQLALLEQTRRTATEEIPARFRKRLAELERDALEGGASRFAALPTLPWFERQLQRWRPWLSEAALLRGKGSLLLQRMGSSDLSRDLLRRYQSRALDAGELRDLVERWSDTGTLPESYLALFRSEAVQEHRLFTARKDELARLVAAEHRWLEGGPSSALITGMHGAGRSSLLAQSELELSAPRVLSPEPLRWRRDVGILQALAYTLGCRPQMAAVVHALSTTRTAVLLDDLEHWFHPTLGGLRELERFLDLVVQTQHDVFWIVTIERDTLGLLEEAFPIQPTFGTIITLDPLTPRELRHAITARHALSGRDIAYPSTVLSSLFRRLPGMSDEEVFFRVLGSICEGNLGRAVATWVRSVDLGAEAESVRPDLGRLLAHALPFVARLSTEDQAALLQVVRFGPMGQLDLQRSLGLTRGAGGRRLSFLAAAGLLDAPDEPDGPHRIPAHIRPLVCFGLQEARRIR